MIVTLTAIALTVLLVPLIGGSFRRLAAVRLEHELSIAVLFVVQGLLRGRLVAGVSAGGLAVAAWGASCVILIALLWTSRRRAGIPLSIAGVCLNALVVMLNDGMPVFASDSVAVQSAFYHRVGPGDTLVWAADVLPLHSGGVVSLGDVLLVIGVCVFILRASTQPVSIETTART